MCGILTWFVVFCPFPAAWRGMCTQTIVTVYWKSKLLHGYLTSLCSTMALIMSTWRKTSSWPAVQQLVLRPLLTCARYAAASVFPLENTSSFPLPLNQTRTQTFICGYSLRKMLISSKFTTQNTRSKPYSICLSVCLSYYSNIYHWAWLMTDFSEIDDSVECHIEQVKSHLFFFQLAPI